MSTSYPLTRQGIVGGMDDRNTLVPLAPPPPYPAVLEDPDHEYPSFIDEMLELEDLCPPLGEACTEPPDDLWEEWLQYCTAQHCRHVGLGVSTSVII